MPIFLSNFKLAQIDSRSVPSCLIGLLTYLVGLVQCDEAHPICRNCQKSKRECLGYDPIFKSQPGPPAIQPAPSSAPAMQATSATSSPYPPPPQGYVPASSQAYAPILSTGPSSPASSSEPFDYAAAIDPALDGSGDTQAQLPHTSYDSTAELKERSENANSYSPDLQNHNGEVYHCRPTLGGAPVWPMRGSHTVLTALCSET